jgi:putative tryptophan/tyrosine transport system substrate-binding protein
MIGKWLQMLTQITPPVARMVVLYNPATAPYAAQMLHTIEEAAPHLAVAVRAAPVNDDTEIEATMAGLPHEEHSGLLVLPDIFNYGNRDAIVALAARHRLPAVYPFRAFTELGGLMSYGVEVILRGTKPADLPVQTPTKFETVINLKTAKVLGLTVPPSLLASADDVIE